MRANAVALGAAGAIALASVAMVWRRAAEGIQPYGRDGAAWIEHAERLAFVQAWHRRQELGLRPWLDEIDGLYPPGLHAVTSVWGAFVGHGAAEVGWTGALWLLLLAAAVAATTREVGGSVAAASAAFAGTCLLPAAHAFATRYYYDLPMTAVLWLAVAVALRSWDRRPVLGGLAAGALWAFADLIKWASLLFGGLLLLAALLTPSARPLRRGARILALSLATAVSLGVSAGWISLAGGESSLGVMLEQMWGGGGGGGGSLGELLGGLGAWLGDKGVFLGTRLTGDRAGFYAVQSFTAVWSPLLGVACLVLAARGGRRALTLAVAGPGLLGLFLVLWIPVLDERFLLTAAPALLPAAALGLTRLPRSAAIGAAAMYAALGLWVGAAFHGLAPDLPGPVWESVVEPSSGAPARQARGLGLADSVERRGWSHARSTPSPQGALRESLWATIARQEPSLVAFPAGPPEAAPAGEFHWLDYRGLLAAEQEGAAIFDFAEGCAADADLFVVPAARDASPDCAPPGAVELRRWPVEDERWQLVLLARPD